MKTDELREYIASLPFIDSHSHMAGFDFGIPLDDKGGKNLPQILMNDYLAYLSGSCSDAPVAPQQQDGGAVEDAEDAFRAALPVMDRCRGMSTYAVLREGIRELYGIDGEDITLENWAVTNRKVIETYRQWGERAWQREVIRRAGVKKQAQICYLPYLTDHWGELPPGERAAQAAVLMPSLVLDGYLFTGFAANVTVLERSKVIVGLHPGDYGQYLVFCEKVLDRFIKEGGNSVKLLAAYSRTLQFDEVPDDAAAKLYAMGPETLTDENLKRLQDNLLWRLLEMAAARRLPLLIHTGYSIPPDWGETEKLWNLFTSPRLRGLKFGLCHAGWPNYGHAMIPPRTWRNCYYDISWIPLLSPPLAAHILATAIDIIPANKILMGTDCGSPESFLGTARLIRRLLNDVLSEKMRAGQFGMRVAKSLAKAMLHDNACEFFNLRDVFVD